MYQFSVGEMWATRSDVPNSTPRNFGVLQEVSLDMSRSMKELYGQNMLPVDVAPGQMKITGKAKWANIMADPFNELFLNGNITTGEEKVARFEDGVLATNTVTVANASNFKEDLGVVYAATGKPLTKVSSAPTAGQYSVSNAGVYTFNTTDQTAQTAAGSVALVRISYRYGTTGSGRIITVDNQLIGSGPEFSLVWTAQYKGKQANYRLHKCIASKWPTAGKSEDYQLNDIEFSCFVDASGRLMTLSYAE